MCNTSIESQALVDRFVADIVADSRFADVDRELLAVEARRIALGRLPDHTWTYEEWYDHVSLSVQGLFFPHSVQGGARGPGGRVR